MITVDPIKFTCPGCQARLTATADEMGRQINCPACQHEIVLRRAKPDNLAALICLIGVVISAVIGFGAHSFAFFAAALGSCLTIAWCLVVLDKLNTIARK